MIFDLILALGLGAAIGLEREAYERRIDKTKRSGVGSLGIRSYSLITLLGALSGIVYPSYLPLFLVISVAFILLLAIYYIIGSMITRDVGMTSELAILLSYVIGVCIGAHVLPLQIVIAVTVVLILILSMKDEIKAFVAGMKEYEIEAFISYGIIALVILPFLPNVSYTFSHIPGAESLFKAYHIGMENIKNLELINPFALWRVVVLITGIEVAGYILEKTIGQKKGWLFASIAGGFISSTSTTQSLAVQSKKSRSVNRLVGAALLANMSSFIQHFILLASININLLIAATPYVLALFLSSGAASFFFLTRKEKKGIHEFDSTRKKLNEDSIFSLRPALQFAVIFLIVKIISKISLVLFGNGGFYATAAISSVTGIDAITITIGEIVGKSLSTPVAVQGLVIANSANLLAKSAFAFSLGKREFALSFLAGVAVIIGASIGAVVIF